MGRFARALALLILLTLTLSPVQSRATNLDDDNDEHSIDRPSPENVLMNQKIIEADFPEKVSTDVIEFTAQDATLKEFAKVDPKKVVPKDLLATTLAFLLKNKSKFKNQNYVTVVDFSAYSGEARMYIVPLNGTDVQVFHTTHGVGSDPNDIGIPQVFGNVDMSGMSSIGFFRSAETYHGQYGYALRIDGLSKTNSNVRMRDVVFHGWEKAIEKDVKQARSHGCFAFDFKVRDGIINKIKNGSLIYANKSGTH